MAGSAAAAVVSVAAVRREVGKVSTLTSDEHHHLSTAIQSLEQEVDGELVVVVAKASDSYRFIPTLWAALAALAVPGVYLLWQWLTLGGWPDPTTHRFELVNVYIAQVTVFFGLLLLFHWPSVQRLIVPKFVLKQRSSRFAREQFLNQGLHHTTERCGVMVFISLMEHHVEILVDKGLADHVQDSYWEATVANMIPHLRKRQTAQACELAINAVASMMHQHAPRNAHSSKDNELPDHVIEL